MEDFFAQLRPLVADKLFQNDQERFTSFTLPIVSDRRFQVMPSKSDLWLQLLAVLGVCTLVKCFFSFLFYAGGVGKNRGRTTLQILEWGFFLPALIPIFFWSLDLFRTFSTDTLEAAPDDELRLYLLQLVQALKFEDSVVAFPSSSMAPVSYLATYLIGRAAKNMQLANYLYWYLKVELHDPTHGPRYQKVFSEMERELSQRTCKSTDTAAYIAHLLEPNESSPIGDDIDSMFKPIASSIADSMSRLSTEEGAYQSMWDVLVKQDEVITGLMNIQMISRDTEGRRDEKQDKLRLLLNEGGYAKHDSIPLPTSPSIMVNGINIENSKLFKSAGYAALLEFNIDDTESNRDESRGGIDKPSGDSVYKMIVKNGDDLRQDQLVIMMIQLMDGLLKQRVSLDMCLSPYSIIVTSPTSGLIEFVDGSMPVSAILTNFENSVLKYLQHYAPDPSGKYNVHPDAMSCYVRSCAGYSVLTYILAVGDRHLDNLLIAKTGQFFHIDFGFIFGNDPKPLPPAFRLTYEMVEGMGGLESSEYQQFRSLACEAFNALRKSSSLILDLLHLMSNAGVEDLSNNPSLDASGVIQQVEERLQLDKTDAEAERYFLSLIDVSLAALAPRLMDQIHAFAVARR